MTEERYAPANLVIVGATSYLARSFAREYPGARLVDARDPALAESLENARVVVNFAFDPKLFDGPYRIDHDIDLRVASLMGATVERYVMLSSRAVYGANASWPCHEDTLGGAVSQYGANKRHIEAALRSLVGDRLMCIRISNVIGFEYGMARRSFMARAMTALRDTGVVTFDHDLSVRKDFLPLPVFSRGLRQLVDSRLAGTFNLGSGLGLPVGGVIEALVRGYGGGRVEVTRPDDRSGAFFMNMDRASEVVGPAVSEREILHFATELGVKLRHA